MKNRPMEEKPKGQSGFVFQQVATSVPSSVPLFSFGSLSSSKGSDKTIGQLNVITTTNSQVPSNIGAFGLKKEEMVSDQDNLKKESFATSSNINSMPGSAKSLFSEEKVATSSSSTVQNKQSSFTKQLGTTAVFGNATVPSSDEIPSSSSSLSTTFPVFSGPSIFAKPKTSPTTTSQKVPTQPGISGFQFSPSLATVDQTNAEQQSIDVISKEVPKTDSQFLSSKSPPTTFSIASSVNKEETSSLLATQPFSFVTERSQDIDALEISTLTVAKTTSTSLYGTPAEFASGLTTKSSENSANLFSFAPKTTPLFGGSVTTTITTTVKPSLPNQGPLGQTVSGTISSQSSSNAELSIKSTFPSTQSVTKLIGSSEFFHTGTVTSLEAPLPSVSSKIVDGTSTSHVTTGASTASLPGVQTTTSSPAIPAFESRVSGVSTSLFGGANTATISSFSTNKPAVSVTAFGSAFATKTSESSSSLNNSNVDTTTSMFGGQSSIFGSNASQTSSNIFTTSSASTKSSVFGVPSSAIETSAGFGSSSSAGSSGLFGGASTGAPSLFSVSTQAKTASSGIFGAASTSSASLFGAQTTTTSSGLFGQTVSSAPTLFGQQQTSTVFGTQPTDAKPSGLFSTPAASQNNGGLFGFKTSTTSGGIFRTASTSQPVFGQASTPFGSQQTSSTSAGISC